jgi:signal transduction histidine kinase
VTEAIKVENELQKSRLEQVELESREKAKFVPLLLHYLERRQRLTSLVDIRTDFLTTMSHELRTPTAQILGVLELVLADKENPLLADHRSLLEQAIRSGDALLELIGAVLVSFFAFLSPLGQMLIVNFRTIGREKS